MISPRDFPSSAQAGRHLEMVIGEMTGYVGRVCMGFQTKSPFAPVPAPLALPNDR
jgi:hypothetical protein